LFKINEKQKDTGRPAPPLTIWPWQRDEPIGNLPISNNDLICGQTTTG
jgi:hypothetical protein